MKNTLKYPLVVILDNIRSAYNVGSALRTAECAGIEAVVTCGFTPPADHPKVKKTSLGAEALVQSTHFSSLNDAIITYQKKGYSIYALEIGENSKSLWEADLPERPTAFIFGHELNGVQIELVKQYYLPMLHIPMFGEKESLNVANANAIAVYDVVKRWAN